MLNVFFFFSTCKEYYETKSFIYQIVLFSSQCFILFNLKYVLKSKIRDHKQAWNISEVRLVNSFLQLCKADFLRYLSFSKLQLDLCLVHSMGHAIMTLFHQGRYRGGQESLSHIIQIMKSTIQCDRVVLSFFDKTKKYIFPALDTLSFDKLPNSQSGNTLQTKKPAKRNVDKHIARHVILSNQSYHISDAYQDPLFSPEEDFSLSYKTKSILCIPVRSPEDDILGIIELINKFNPSKTALEEVPTLNNSCGSFYYKTEIASHSISPFSEFDEWYLLLGMLEIEEKKIPFVSSS